MFLDKQQNSFIEDEVTEKLPELSTLKLGSTGTLAAKVMAEGGSDFNRITPEALQAIASFQARIGFEPSNRIDPNTLMNWLTLSSRSKLEIAQQALKSCMELDNVIRQNRLTRYIEVNIPSQTLRAYEFDPSTGRTTEVIRSRVIVGATYSPTPLSHINAVGVKLNPEWTATVNISTRKLFPKGQFNPAWLIKSGVKVYDSNGRAVPTSEVTAENYKKMRFVQPAGADSALGLVKIETDSTQAIYLHDTPEQSLFANNERLASAGCVRTEEIQPLARWLLGAFDNPETAEWFDRLLDSGKTSTRKMDNPVPVFMSYRLADKTESGDTVFFADSYKKSGLNLTIVKPQE